MKMMAHAKSTSRPVTANGICAVSECYLGKLALEITLRQSECRSVDDDGHVEHHLQGEAGRPEDAGFLVEAPLKILGRRRSKGYETLMKCNRMYVIRIYPSPL